MFFGGLRNRGWSDAAKDATWAFALPIIALGPIALVRVEVDAHEIRYQNFGIVWKRAQFDDIGRSFANVLGEKDWPVSLTLIAKDGKTELMVIRLKMLRKQDVDWLLSLPQLKLKR